MRGAVEPRRARSSGRPGLPGTPNGGGACCSLPLRRPPSWAGPQPCGALWSRPNRCRSENARRRSPSGSTNLSTPVPPAIRAGSIGLCRRPRRLLGPETSIWRCNCSRRRRSTVTGATSANARPPPSSARQSASVWIVAIHVCFRSRPMRRRLSAAPRSTPGCGRRFSRAAARTSTCSGQRPRTRAGSTRRWRCSASRRRGCERAGASDVSRRCCRRSRGRRSSRRTMPSPCPRPRRPTGWRVRPASRCGRRAPGSPRPCSPDYAARPTLSWSSPLTPSVWRSSPMRPACSRSSSTRAASRRSGSGSPTGLRASPSPHRARRSLPPYPRLLLRDRRPRRGRDADRTRRRGTSGGAAPRAVGQRVSLAVVSHRAHLRPGSARGRRRRRGCLPRRVGRRAPCLAVHARQASALLWGMAATPPPGRRFAATASSGARRLDALGVPAWSERARRELRASGEGSQRRLPATLEELTPQELQIAQMAADGFSNRDIGERLFLSHRTVESHLYRVFPKLGVTSRGQLAEVLTRHIVPIGAGARQRRH